MIYLSNREVRLLKYATSNNADLSRDALAAVLGVVDVSVGRLLTRLKNRGLINIKRGRNRRILSIQPTFDFTPGAYLKRIAR